MVVASVNFVDSSSLRLKTDGSDVTKLPGQTQVKEEDAESVVSSSSEDSQGAGGDASGESRSVEDDIGGESRAADTDTSAGRVSASTVMKEINQAGKIPELRSAKKPCLDLNISDISLSLYVKVKFVVFSVLD